MNDPINPYTPPTVDVLEAEQRDFPWYVAARGIHVQDGAVLPEIDLLTGEESGDLLPVAHRVNVTKGTIPRIPAILFLVVVGAIFAIDLPLAWAIACAAGAGGLINLLFRKSHPRVNFTFFSSGTARSAANTKVVLRVIEVASMVAAFGSLALLQIYDWGWVGFFVFIFLSHLVAKRKEKTTTRGLEVREAAGVTGWVRIGGAHPAALARLDEIQKQRGHSEPPEPQG